jgi:hypothetical protein
MESFVAESKEVLLEHPHFPVFGMRSVKTLRTALSLSLFQESTTEARRVRLGCVMGVVRTLLALVRADPFLVPHFDPLSMQQLSEEWTGASALVVVEPRFMYMYLTHKYRNSKQAAETWRAGYRTHGESFFV